jgi:hypothetical protein
MARDLDRLAASVLLNAENLRLKIVVVVIVGRPVLRLVSWRYQPWIYSGARRANSVIAEPVIAPRKSILSVR